MAWRQLRDRLRDAGLDTPELDARLIAQHVFGVDSMGLFRREREIPRGEDLRRLEQLGDRRLTGEPVSRIVGEKEFWSLRFGLNEATLVPRPETEMLVSEAIAILELKRTPRFIDLGTGSGAIAISVAVGVKRATGYATDLAEAALVAARANAERHGVAGRIEFRQGMWWSAVPPGETFDVIVSNPPYIASGTIDTLAPDVRLFDPKLALDGGWDGLEAYRAIAGQALRHLNAGGTALFEIGSTQGEILQKMFDRAGFKRVEVLKDLAGLDRVLVCSHS